MRILFVTTAHNSLSQRLALELSHNGHTLAICLAISADQISRDVERHQPDLIVSPMLKTAIPEKVWRRNTCLIVHPGIKGDRGPSSLDWAISTGQEQWGVTVLQAIEEMDAGPIWASETFPMPRRASKSSLYRAEVTEAAVRAVLNAVVRFESKSFEPETLDYNRSDVTGVLRPSMRQRDRAIDWQTHSTSEIARKVRAADSSPGLQDTVIGQPVHLYGAHEEDLLTGLPGQILGQRNGAICLGTSDGAIWISHLKANPDESGVVGVKLPAAQVLGDQLAGVPTLDLPVDDTTTYRTFREIRYIEDADVGYLSFDFYNGAMSTDQCTRLRRAFVLARSRPTRVICLSGGRDYWSNGIHLNVIQGSADPALESWRNIQAMNDLILEILDTPQHLVVAAMRGNAGAGGAMLAIAADQVFARSGIVINPHYRSMGNLYGSEYWTYTLPRKVGAEKALELTEACEPIGTGTALEIGFIDAAFGPDVAGFQREVTTRARRLARHSEYASFLAWKQQLRAADEAAKPLANYRAEELTRMWDNFFGSDASYHHARRQFVLKSTSAAPVELQSRLRGLSPAIAA